MPARGVAYYCGTQGEVLRFWKLGISSTPCGGFHKRGRGPPTLWWILMVFVHCISSLTFFAHVRDFFFGLFVNILQKKVIMYWCDLVCIYAGGDVPVTPLHSNLVSGKTGAADRRHSHGIASPHRSTLKVKNCDKKQQTNIMSPPLGFLWSTTIFWL